MSRWSLPVNLPTLWTPGKQTKESAPTPASSPLAEENLNRIQKPRNQKSRTGRLSRQRLRDLASKVANSTVLEEINNNGSSPASRRGSNASQSHHDSRDWTGLDLEVKDDDAEPESSNSIRFSPQPPQIPFISSTTDVDTQGRDEFDDSLVTATPNELPGEDDEEELPPQGDAAELSVLGEEEEEVEVEEENAESDDDEEYTFTDLLNYRWEDDEIEIEVQWHGYPPTWEPEVNLHRDAPDTLFKFWQSQGGRPDNPRDPDLYDIFAIRKHSPNRQKLFVEWTGYPPSENCWVPLKVVNQTAPKVVDEYFKSLPKKSRKRS